MTHKEALEKLDELCAEYNIDEHGKMLFAVMMAPVDDKEAALRCLEAEFKRRGRRRIEHGPVWKEKDRKVDP